MVISAIGIQTQNQPNYNKPIKFGESETTTNPPNNTTSDNPKNDTVEIQQSSQKKEASTSKKWGVGIASACITGLGQLINGEVGKAFAFFAGGLTAGGLAILFSKSDNKALSGTFLIGSLGISIWSIVDAVSNAKPSKE